VDFDSTPHYANKKKDKGVDGRVSIKTHLKETGYDEDLIHVSEDRVWLRGVVNTAMNLRIP
jgi:hypothetical protein